MSIINVKIIWKIYVLAMNFITCSEYNSVIVWLSHRECFLVLSAAIYLINLKLLDILIFILTFSIFLHLSYLAANLPSFGWKQTTGSLPSMHNWLDLYFIFNELFTQPLFCILSSTNYSRNLGLHIFTLYKFFTQFKFTKLF